MQTSHLFAALFCTYHLPHFHSLPKYKQIIAGFTTSTQTDKMKQLWVSTHYIRLRTRRISTVGCFSRGKEKKKSNQQTLLHILIKKLVSTTPNTQHVLCQHSVLELKQLLSPSFSCGCTLQIFHPFSAFVQLAKTHPGVLNSDPVFSSSTLSRFELIFL